jgi:hypothetical protein
MYENIQSSSGFVVHADGKGQLFSKKQRKIRGQCLTRNPITLISDDLQADASGERMIFCSASGIGRKDVQVSIV